MLLENRAGELTAVAAKLAEAGVNLEAAYVVGLIDDLIELAIVSDDVKKAKKLLADVRAKVVDSGGYAARIQPVFVVTGG